jgi:hypothetical protein
MGYEGLAPPGVFPVGEGEARDTCRAADASRPSDGLYRYEARPDHNVSLREMICALANRHKRYSVGMIYLKLRQAGHAVNYKRVERFYQEAKLAGAWRAGRLGAVEVTTAGAPCPSLRPRQHVTLFAEPKNR